MKTKHRLHEVKDGRHAGEKREKPKGQELQPLANSPARTQGTHQSRLAVSPRDKPTSVLQKQKIQPFSAHFHPIPDTIPCVRKGNEIMGVSNSIRHTTIQRSITPRRATKRHNPARTGAKRSRL
jgi:hypothetical protein